MIESVMAGYALAWLKDERPGNSANTGKAAPAFPAFPELPPRPAEGRPGGRQAFGPGVVAFAAVKAGIVGFEGPHVALVVELAVALRLRLGREQVERAVDVEVARDMSAALQQQLGRHIGCAD